MPQYAIRYLKCALVLVFLLLVCAPLIVADEAVGIAWDAARPLSWSDFQGVAPPTSGNLTEPAAIHMTIHWRVSYSATCANGRTWSGRVETAEVSNVMSPGLSWAVPGQTNALILLHEQTHFDLNEVYRRKLEHALLSVQTQGGSQQGVVDALNERVHAIAKQLLNRLVAMQDVYDAETSPGLNQPVQNRWKDQVSLWLIDPSLAPS